MNQIKQSAKEIGQAAEAAARERAEAEQLTVEGLKSQARRTGGPTRGAWGGARETSEVDASD
jgi:hypothetical protein